MRTLLLAYAMAIMGCAGTDTNDDFALDRDVATPIVLNEFVGPDHDADVQLADADLWIVPPLRDVDAKDFVVWTLEHPALPTNSRIRRFCNPNVTEPYLWLRDPSDPGDRIVAMLHGCTTNGGTYGMVELAYNGTEWVGVSAIGSATLVPSK